MCGRVGHRRKAAKGSDAGPRGERASRRTELTTSHRDLTPGIPGPIGWEVGPLARGPYVSRPAGPFQLVDGTLVTNQYGLAPSEAEAVGLSAVWRCLCVIADSVSAAPWGEWRGLNQLPTSRLVRRPAQSMTRREWTWLVVATLALYNVAYLREAGGADSEGVPWSLIPIPPMAITPEDPDPWGIRPPTAYRIAGERVSAEEIRRLRRAMLPSIPPEMAALLTLARATIGAAIAAEWYAAGFWMGGAAPLVVLSVDQEMTAQQMGEYADTYQEHRATDPSRPLVLGKSGKADTLGADLSNASAIEARNWLVADVARYFGVPPHLVNAPTGDSMTYQNVEQAGLDLARYCLGPFARPVEDVISDTLPGDPQEGRHMRIDLTEFTAGGFLDRAQGYALATGSRPWLTPEEVRAREGRPPVGDLPPELAPPPAPTPPPAAPAPPAPGVPTPPTPQEAPA